MHIFFSVESFRPRYNRLMTSSAGMISQWTKKNDVCDRKSMKYVTLIEEMENQSLFRNKRRFSRLIVARNLL